MLKVTILLVVLASASASLEADWAVFKDKYQREYNDELEDLRRRDIYAATMKRVKAHNELYAQGLSSYYMGENQFSDWTEEEFFGKRTRKSNNATVSRKTHHANIDVSKLPESVDWRKKGYVTSVGNQGNCESSYAFGVLASLEGQYFKYKGQLLKLSASQILDCSYDPEYGNRGCNLGFISAVYSYIYSAGGVELESSYPYDDRRRNCTFQKDKVAATISGSIPVSGGELGLQKAIATVGPIPADINVIPTYRDYSGGVYDDPDCDSYAVFHVVAIVGYGTEKGKDYWLVKNSWGKRWGEEGYIKMARNKNNQCGITTFNRYPSIPTV